jgi:ribosomal protein S18
MSSIIDQAFDEEQKKMRIETEKRLKKKMVDMINGLDYEDTVMVNRFLTHRGDIQKFFELAKILGRNL